MKNIFLTIIYIICFTIVSLVISQIFGIIAKEELFENDNEIILSIIAGIASGLIVGIFNKEPLKEN